MICAIKGVVCGTAARDEGTALCINGWLVKGKLESASTWKRILACCREEWIAVWAHGEALPFDA